MKRFILIVTLILYFSSAFSQTIPSNIVSVSQSGNSIVITFNLPPYTIEDVSLYEPYGITDNYKFIELDYFGYTEDVAHPQVPQLTIDLTVPEGAHNFQVIATDRVTETIFLDSRIVPAQEDYEEDPNFSINELYYTGGIDLYGYPRVSDPFVVFGQTGVSLTIFPFSYLPRINMLNVTKQITYTLTYDDSGTTSPTYDSPVKNSYLSNFFENYSVSSELTRSSVFKGRYLMITAPEFESTLTYFANYKRNLGYEVTVLNTNTMVSTNPVWIKAYIQGRYDNIATRPDFVLLVGDYNHIPALGNSSGTNNDDPITDHYYALLDGDDYHADVFLGRFSVSSSEELQNIINKTIYMEMNMHSFQKKAKFIAGKESNRWMQNQFEKGHDEVIKNTFQPLGYLCQKLYQPDYSTVISAINDNPLFFLYSGHGSFTSIEGGSFVFHGDDVLVASNTVFPFAFVFSCKTGNFAYPTRSCMGENWIREKNKGGVAYFGCSVQTMVNSDKAIEEKIFGDSFTKSEYLGGIISLGKTAYWKRFWSFFNRNRTKRYMQAYNLLGDPSLNLSGTSCMSNLTFVNNESFYYGDVVSYHVSNNIQNNTNFHIENGARVNLSAGNSITLKPGFIARQGSDFEAIIQPCDNNKSSKAITVLDIGEYEDKVINPQKTRELITPAAFSIFPNPTNSDFSFSYTLNYDSFVKVELYSLSGFKVRTLLDIARQAEGNYFYNFSISDLSAGAYLFVYSNSSETITTKIIKN